MSTLQVRLGRRFSYLRLSVTYVCNLRGFLALDEIRRQVTEFTELGSWKMRLTGGEPSVRKDFPEIVRTLLQRDDQCEELKACIVDSLFVKTSGHRLHEGDFGDTPYLAMTGG